MLQDAVSTEPAPVTIQGRDKPDAALEPCGHHVALRTRSDDGRSSRTPIDDSNCGAARSIGDSSCHSKGLQTDNGDRVCPVPTAADTAVAFGNMVGPVREQTCTVGRHQWSQQSVHGTRRRTNRAANGLAVYNRAFGKVTQGNLYARGEQASAGAHTSGNFGMPCQDETGTTLLHVTFGTVTDKQPTENAGGEKLERPFDRNCAYLSVEPWHP